MDRVGRAWALALLGVALTPAAASAQLQGGGLDLRLFRPAVDSRGLFAADGSDVLGSGALSFGLHLDAGFGLIPYGGFVDEPGRSAGTREVTHHLVDLAATGTLQANVGVPGSVVVGLQLPVQLLVGPDVVVPGVFNDPASGGASFQGVSDLSLHVKWRVLRRSRAPVGLALVLRAELPTGSPSQLAGDGLALLPSAALEVGVAPRLRLLVNLGARVPLAGGASVPVGGRSVPRNADATDATPVALGEEVTYGPMFTLVLGAAWRVVGPAELILEAYASQLFDRFGSSSSFSAEALGGVRVFVDGRSYLYLAAGPGLSPRGLQTADARAVLGFVFEPGTSDRDGDGYADDDDACPDEPEDFDDFDDGDGCIDPDDDRDGILDVADECRLVPEDRDGDADQDGCPEGDEADRDGDGRLDSADQCPDDPEDLDGFEGDDGCPDSDNDRDGHLDRDDLCPDDPEDRDGFQDDDGCRDEDNDDDRILDVDDRCPDRAEVYNGEDDHDGCPDEGIVELEGDGITLFREIRFATDSAVILPESYPLVDAIARTLLAAVHLTRIEIGGHADERGSDEYNLLLTRDRAAAVRLALIDRGVGPGRLASFGYGESCPKDRRRTPDAWGINRRVEVRILETMAGSVETLGTCREP